MRYLSSRKNPIRRVNLINFESLQFSSAKTNFKIIILINQMTPWCLFVIIESTINQCILWILYAFCPPSRSKYFSTVHYKNCFIVWHHELNILILKIWNALLRPSQFVKLRYDWIIFTVTFIPSFQFPLKQIKILKIFCHIYVYN